VQTSAHPVFEAQVHLASVIVVHAEPRQCTFLGFARIPPFVRKTYAPAGFRRDTLHKRLCHLGDGSARGRFRLFAIKQLDQVAQGRLVQQDERRLAALSG
jgi:hypothetical protein